MAKRVSKPPPMIDGCRITHYVVRDRSVPFVGRTNLFIGMKDFKELGAVPCLAIGESRTLGIVLFYCGRTWISRGVTPYNDLAEAFAAAERNYPGLRQKWKKTGYSKRRAEVYRRAVWKGMDCSFCGRLADEFQTLFRTFKRRGVGICNDCVARLAARIDPPTPAGDGTRQK